MQVQTKILFTLYGGWAAPLKPYKVFYFMTLSKKFQQKQSICAKRRNLLLKKQTKSEIEFARLLDVLGINYIAQKGFIVGNNFCIVDFYLPSYKTCVEIDGGYHYEESQIKRDLNRDFYLNKQRGFGVLHIDNDSLKHLKVDVLLTILHSLKTNKNVIKI